ncbi:hypothetical protein HYT92_00700 [Candidatus Pacearchaeota archaeon]|nr:hypothetical protein [Candidatus Pacearchaeota archaeon]
MENKTGRCSCVTPKLRSGRSLHCSVCGLKVSRSKREELNFLSLLNGNAEETKVVAESAGKREEKKELVGAGAGSS